MTKYALLLAITLLIYWAVWPMRPEPSDFPARCDKIGDVAELADDGGLICVRGRKVVLREIPLPKTRKARTHDR